MAASSVPQEAAGLRSRQSVTTLAGSGQRRRIEIDGEHYYIILTWDDGAASIDITCPRENAPDNAKMRAVLETVCSTITEMMQG